MAATSDPLVYLASASPRRQVLLAQLGLRWAQIPAVVDESRQPDEPPADYVRRLALAKARAGRLRCPAAQAAPVVSADTTVVVAGTVLGKPVDAADAARMLQLMSGCTHQVLTAVAVASPSGESVALSVSEVVFRTVGAVEAAAYWRSGEPADKAGGYAIQGLGAVFVQELRGSYSGVMGLPLFETAQLLGAHGVPVLAGNR